MLRPITAMAMTMTVGMGPWWAFKRKIEGLERWVLPVVGQMYTIYIPKRGGKKGTTIITIPWGG